jgi:hypothetical protein
MSRVRLIRSLVEVGVVAALVAVPGCGTLERLDDNRTTVFVFSAHHATPVGGIFPARGENEMPRVFDTDLGWTVTLLESYVTTSAVSLVRCDGQVTPLNMFWGPCPEDLRAEDLATLTVAGTKVHSGDFCALEVLYAPYEPPIADGSEDDEATVHDTPENESIMGATVYLRGAARMGDGDAIPFELRSTGDVVASLDLTNLAGDGKPLRITYSEDFPKELTVSKTYDRFFDGVDFSTLDEDVLEDDLLDILDDETIVSLGNRPTMPIGD